MKVEQWKTSDIIPYENNPRVNDMAVDKAATYMALKKIQERERVQNVRIHRG